TLTTGANHSSTTFSGVISGSGGLTKIGTGTLTLSGANTYTGTTSINAGTLRNGAANVIDDASPVTINAGAVYDLANFNESIASLAGSGAVTLGSGTLTTGLNGSSTIYAGVISGSGGLTKTGTGTFVLTGANTYTGATTINQGVLQNGASGVIADTSAVTIALGATYDLNNFSETIGSLAGSGNVVLQGNLTVGGNNLSTTYNGVVSGNGSFTKIGSGTLTLTNTHFYTGSTTINGGTLAITGTLMATSGVTVNNTGTLAGTGSVNSPVVANSGGTVAPGVGGPGILNTFTTTFATGSTFNVTLNGTTVGSQYDQLNVTGTVTLGNATLTGTLGFSPAVGDTFTIINNDGTDPVNGTFAGLPEGALVTIGNRRFKISYVGGTGNDVVLTARKPDVVGIIATGTDGPATSHVRVFDAGTLVEKFSFFAYPGFMGGVRVAVGDVNGDGVADIVTAPGPGGGPHVQVFDGNNGGLLNGFMAYAPTVTNGLFVAVGDVNNDGYGDIIVAPDQGAAPHVVVISGFNYSLIHSFYAFSPAFTGGVRVAAGDTNADDHADIVVGAGPGGGPHVMVYNGPNLAVLASFFAYAPSFTAGVFVGVGDVNGDGYGDVLTGPGFGGGPHLRVFSGVNYTQLHSFFAFPPGVPPQPLVSNSVYQSGLRVAAVDVNADGRMEILAAPGKGYQPKVRIFDGLSLALIDEFFAYSPTFQNGVFVAGQNAS
ncbi:MAG: autotransporter-associated beta strand repeat-containing protein, partial [Gemmataceae bacterium]|nr:autotransporter-associated beta strand repeat-containing protein [Gemmataceae bacterium]MDW8265641.1 autotransporter-associated beta strand repeat-containing protein [Gemmataceae bacterium]